MRSREREEGGWRTSSYSSDNGGQCVRVRAVPDGSVAVGDTKATGVGPVHVSRVAWGDFLASLHR